MVGPVSDRDRVAFFRKLKLGVVVLVGLSAGLVALQVGAPPLVLGAGVVAGCLVGAVLVWVAFPDVEDMNLRSGRSRR